MQTKFYDIITDIVDIVNVVDIVCRANKFCGGKNVIYVVNDIVQQLNHVIVMTLYSVYSLAMSLLWDFHPFGFVARNRQT